MPVGATYPLAGPGKDIFGIVHSTIYGATNRADGPTNCELF